MELIYWDPNYNKVLLLNFIIVIGLFASIRFFLGAIAHVDTSEQLFKKDNPAFGLSLTGVVFAISILLSGLIFGGPDIDLVRSGIKIAAYGITGIFLMIITRIIFDKITLPDISLRNEINKGNILVKSILGEGSCFTVYLPVLKNDEKQSSKKSAAGLKKSEEKTLRVLVVDDNHESAFTLGELVRLIGCDAQVENSGQAAIEAAQEFQPNVVLMDIGMPGMSGYEACKILKEMPLMKDTVFIAQTGWGEKQHQEKSKEAGFDYHLTKPIDLQVLNDLLDSLKS